MPNNTPAGGLEKALRVIHWIEDGILAGLLTTMILLASLQIFLRNLFDSSLLWADPLLKIMVLWVGLLGALAASRQNKQITVDVLSRILPPRPQQATRVFTSAFTAAVCAIIAYHSARFVAMDFEAGSMTSINIPAWVFETIIPISFGLITLRYLIHVVLHTRTLLRGESAA